MRSSLTTPPAVILKPPAQRSRAEFPTTCGLCFQDLISTAEGVVTAYDPGDIAWVLTCSALVVRPVCLPSSKRVSVPGQAGATSACLLSCR